MDQLPKLRTVLDLRSDELKEVPSFSPQLELLLKIANSEDKLYTPGQGLEQSTLPTDEFFLARVLLTRLKHHAPESLLTPSMLGAAVSMCQSPANAVQWAHTFAAHWYRTGTAATVQNILVKALDGFLPTQPGLLNIWDEQKVPRPVLRQFRTKDPMASDNWLDYPQAWKPEVLAPVPAPS